MTYQKKRIEEMTKEEMMQTQIKLLSKINSNIRWLTNIVVTTFFLALLGALGTML